MNYFLIKTGLVFFLLWFNTVEASLLPNIRQSTLESPTTNDDSETQQGTIPSGNALLEPNILENSLPGKYIIIFRAQVKEYQIQEHFRHLRSIYKIEQRGNPINTIKLEPFQIGNIFKQKDSPILSLNGYILHVCASTQSVILNYLKRAPLIKIIESNSEIHLNKQITQNDTPWGLTRISQRDRVFIGDKQKYFYDSESLRNSTVVNAYVLDTGINIEHKQFEGRASWGKTIQDNDNNIDNNGHGTHCAGVIGSRDFGVAKGVNLIAVKILRSNGDGEMVDLIKGIEYVVNDHNKNLFQQNVTNFKGSVINLSIGAGKSPALTAIIEAATRQGVNFAVAAGNEDENACYFSPSDSKDVITVGATGFSDARAFFSNWGPCLDIFAPGMNILSTFIGPGNNETLSLTGTSMAAPHVAGLVAYLLSLQPECTSQYSGDKRLVSPDTLKKKIMDFATKDILYDIPDWTPNLMAFNGRGHNLTQFWKE